MRLFIAVDIDESIKDKIISTQKIIGMPGMKAVEPENLHFCLKFIGEAEEEAVPEIKNIIKEVSEKFEEFSLSIEGIGSFPSDIFINTIWAGAIEGKEILRAIAEMLDFELSKLGFEKESREFIPHLTLYRVKKIDNKEKLINNLAKMKTTKFGTMTVKSIKLIKSELTPEGPKYETVYESELNKAP